MKREWIYLFIIFVIGILLIFREIVVYQYYQNSVPDKYAYFLLLPIILFVSIGVTIDASRSITFTKDNRFWKTIKTFLGTISMLSILSYFLVVPFVSGIILFLNEKIGEQESILVSGKILKIADDESYSVTIFRENSKLVFDTTIRGTEMYDQGDIFNEKMKKGCFGIIYKCHPSDSE